MNELAEGSHKTSKHLRGFILDIYAEPSGLRSAILDGYQMKNIRFSRVSTVHAYQYKSCGIGDDS